jgi:hypothetical protein
MDRARTDTEFAAYWRARDKAIACEHAGDHVLVRLGGVLRDAQGQRLVDASVGVGEVELEGAHRRGHPAR